MIWSKKETGKKEEGTAQKSDGSFQKKYLIEQERVTKLWKAYQIQEKTLKQAEKRNEEILMELEFLKEKFGVKEKEGGSE